MIYSLLGSVSVLQKLSLEGGRGDAPPPSLILQKCVCYKGEITEIHIELTLIRRQE